MPDHKPKKKRGLTTILWGKRRSGGRIYCPNFIQIDTTDTIVLFSVLGDIDPKIFFETSKTSFTVIFWNALQHITWKKFSK